MVKSFAKTYVWPKRKFITDKHAWLFDDKNPKTICYQLLKDFHLLKADGKEQFWETHYKLVESVVDQKRNTVATLMKDEYIGE